MELAEFLTKEGAYDIFDATEVTEVMQRFDKDGNGHLSPDEMLELRNVLRTSELFARLLLRWSLCLFTPCTQKNELPLPRPRSSHVHHCVFGAKGKVRTTLKTFVVQC